MNVHNKNLLKGLNLSYLTNLEYLTIANVVFSFPSSLFTVRNFKTN